MLRHLMNFVKIIFLFVFLLLGGLYVLNFTVAGDKAFVTKDSKLYSMSDETEVLKTLKYGTSVSLLTYADNDKVVKVRYEDSKSEKQLIGFMSTDSCYSYTYPTYQMTATTPILLSVKSNSSLKSFLNEFVSANEEYSIIGVYLEASGSDNSFSQIESFCEEQGIPYGEIWELNDSSYEAYLHDVAAEALNEGNDLYKYNILPLAFTVSGVDITKYPDLNKCVLYTDSESGLDKHSSWVSVKSKTRDSNLFNDGTIVASEFQSSSKFGYSFVSDDFEKEIDDAYDTIN